MASQKLRQICLEVERKFTRLRVYPLTKDGGNPSFHSLKYFGIRTFRDIYFDHHGQLAAAGTWVRQRDGKWQSKIRQSGDFQNSSFRETQDTKEITEHVSSIIHSSSSSDVAFGLSSIADITTHRETWKANDRFAITLDRTDFDHVVGEVELEESVSVGSDEDASRISRSMDQDIAAFMQRYQWAFETGPAIGKLTAYFKRHNANGPEAKM